MPQAQLTSAVEASRFAQLIANDVLLYNAQQIDAAVATDTLFETMAHEFNEGLLLYKRRVAPGVDDIGNFWHRAIVDVIVASRAGIVSPMW